MCIGNGRAALLALVCSAAIVGCSEDDAVAPTSAGPALSEADLTTLAAEVRALTAGRGIGPLAGPPRFGRRSSSWAARWRSTRS